MHKEKSHAHESLWHIEKYVNIELMRMQEALVEFKECLPIWEFKICAVHTIDDYKFKVILKL